MSNFVFIQRIKTIDSIFFVAQAHVETYNKKSKKNQPQAMPCHILSAFTVFAKGSAQKSEAFC